MEVLAVPFVKASEVFGANSELWDYLTDNSDMTWGDCEHSLVTIDRLIGGVEEAPLFGDHARLPVIDRLKTLPRGVFIDLES